MNELVRHSCLILNKCASLACASRVVNTLDNIYINIHILLKSLLLKLD